jgi:hypothetical protein
MTVKTVTGKWLKEKLNGSKLSYMKANSHTWFFSRNLQRAFVEGLSFVDNGFQNKTVHII